MRNPSVLAVAAVLSLTALDAASGQSSAHRLSSLEATTTTLTVPMRAQAADTMRGRTLVVWGNAESDSTGSVRHVLRMNLLDSTGGFVAATRIVHDESARPSGIVHVTTDANGFVVLWSDRRRSGFGLYARRVDLEGRSGGPDVRVVSGPIEDVSTFHGLGDMFMVHALGAPPVLVDRNLVVDARGLDSNRFEKPHVIRRDSSLVVLDGNVISRYRHFLDDEFEARSIIELADTVATNAWGLFAADDERLHVIAFSLNQTPACLELGLGIRIHLLELNDDLGVRAASIIDSAVVCDDLSSDVRIGGIGRSRQDGGSHYRLTIVVSDKQHGGLPYEQPRHFDFTVSACGAFEWGDRSSTSCRAGSVPAVRASYDSVSSAGVAVGDSIRFASVPVAPIPRAQPDYRPNVVVTGGSILVTFTRALGNDGASGSDALHIVKWEADESRELDTAYLTFGSRRIRPRPLDLGWEHVRNTYWNLAGSTVIAQTKETVFDDNRSFSTSTYAAHIATGTGWLKADEAGGFHNESYLHPIAGTNPNDSSTSISVTTKSGRRRLSIVGPNAEARLSGMLDVDTVVALVPGSDGEQIAVSRRELIRVDTTGIAATVPLNRIGEGKEMWQRELGQTFVRAVMLDREGTLIVERYSTELVRLDSIAVPLPADARDLSMLLDRRDSSLVFLYVSGVSIRLAHLSRDLRIRTSDAVLFTSSDSVARPAGAFVQGRLHLVWEDFRNDAPDVYGLVTEGPFSDIKDFRPNETPILEMDLTSAEPMRPSRRATAQPAADRDP